MNGIDHAQPASSLAAPRAESRTYNDRLQSDSLQNASVQSDTAGKDKHRGANLR